MKKAMHNTVLAFAALCAVGLRAQEGSLDLTFNPTDPGYGAGDGANGTVYAIAQQTDGRVIIGGDLTSYNSTACPRLTRLNTDGSMDASFNTGSGVNGTVRSIAMQPDGKVIVGGDFTMCQGTPRNRILRLNPGGSLDIGFDPGSGADTTVMCIAVQSNGQVIIGGVFTSVAGITRGRLARLNTNGSLDTGFNTGQGANIAIHTIAVQPDGKLLIGGRFTTFNGFVRPHITRLLTDATLDPGFTIGSGAQLQVHSIVLQPDGKILMAGNFSSYNGVARDRIARLNSTGLLDTSFDPGLGSINDIYSMALQSDGKVIIGGTFLYYNGVFITNIARVNANGTLDTGYNVGNGAQYGVRAVAVQPDGKILVGGEFTSYNSLEKNRIVRTMSTGVMDFAFNASTGADDRIYSILIQPDGRILLGGFLTTYNGTPRSRIARLNADGSIDASFDVPTNSFGVNAIHALALQPDGRILVGGNFTAFNGVSRNRILRLNTDGSLDLTFSPGTGASNNVEAIAVLPDGKILLGGVFTTFNGIARKRLLRLNTDGSLDTGFDLGNTFPSGIVEGITLQSDGKILVNGTINNYNGTTRLGLVRINADGSSDMTFNGTSGPNFIVRCVALLADGRIAIGGTFTAFNGTPRNGLARLNTNGAVDTTFDPGTGATGNVNAICAQPDGRLLALGEITAYNGIVCPKILRVNTNGSLDLTFNPGTGLAGIITEHNMTLQPDGQILIGGEFTSYNGVGRNRIARINGTARTAIRVMLDGPYNGVTMNDALRTLPSFPLTEPFTAMGYANAAYSAGAIIPSSVLAATGNNAIVDWVLVEMRPVATPGTVTASRAVLLQRDGDVVDLDGLSTVGFAGLADGNYCVAVRSRNHLPVLSSPAIPITYGGAVANLDFTLPTTLVYDNDARKNVSGVMVLAAGDVTFNGTVSYTGSGNDRDPILTRIGGVIPTNTVSGYWREDVNMDGVVKYTGAVNDRDIILQSIGGTVPTNTRVAGLP